MDHSIDEDVLSAARALMQLRYGIRDFDDQPKQTDNRVDTPTNEQSTTTTKSHSNTTTKARSSSEIFLCHHANCDKGFKTHCGLKKHICSQHEHNKRVVCPVQGCEYATDQRETVLRHLRGPHRMKELPKWGRGRSQADVRAAQAEVFRKHVGDDADVGFFLDDVSAEAE